MLKKFAFLLTATIIFWSCSEDTEPNNQTPEEASTEIHALANQASADITTLVESEGVNGAIALLELLEDYDFSARQSDAQGVREQIHLLAAYFVNGPSQRVGENDPFTFDDIKGLYEWNFETETFDESPSDFFIVLFPTEGSATNNAELKITDLELETIMEVEGEFVDEYQVPSFIDSYLKVDNNTVVALTLDVQWSLDGFPDKADVELFVDPFTFSLGFDQTFALSSSLVTSVQLNGENILGVDLDVKFQTEAKEEPKVLEGFIQYYNLKISGSVDGTFDEEVDDINDFVDLELLLDDIKIGDIIFEEDLAYVVYSDGSKELLEEILEDVIADIEEFFEDFE